MAFTDEQIRAVWNKGTIVTGYDSTKFRKDCCGAWMRRSEYGEQTTYGWEIDHVYPEASGGDDNLINLRPMQWENNRSKADDYPDYTASVISNGDNNIDKNVNKSVNDNLQGELKKLYNL